MIARHKARSARRLAVRRAARVRPGTGQGVGFPRGAPLVALTLAGLATAGGAVALSLMPAAKGASGALVGQRLNRAAGTLAASVLFDSALEHYAGAFQNKAMFTPLAVASLSLAASVHGHGDDGESHRGRDVAYSMAALTGVAGMGFHAYNVTKRPGGLCWQNLFYAAPLGAPAALILSGLLGFLGERVRDGERGAVLGIPAGRLAAGVSGIGMLGTAAEAGLLHLRGAFHDPFMLLPVTVPPVAGLLIGAAAIGEPGARPLTAAWLRVTGLIGLMGSVFHCIGVARMMGGWRNWTQNILAGPPVPAPPAFTGIALAGLAALGLLGDHAND